MHAHRLLPLVVALFAVSPALAHDGDVAPVVSSGRIVTWLGIDDPPPGSLVAPSRVFASEFEAPSPGFPVVTGDPGFLTLPGNDLEGHSLGFNIRTWLRAWDVGSQSVPSALAPATLTMSAPLLGEVTTPLTSGMIPGLTIPSVTPGGFDFHFDHELSDDLPGIYVLELELFTNRPGTGKSLPYWVVFNHGLGEPQHEAAIKWVEANLVPAPGSAIVLGAALVALARRRR